MLGSKTKNKTIGVRPFPKVFHGGNFRGKKIDIANFSFRKEEEISYPDFHEVNLNPDAPWDWNIYLYLPYGPGSELPLFPYNRGRSSTQ